LHICNHAASLAYNEDACCQIPWLQVVLPVSIEAACRCPRQVQRRRACAADASHLAHDRLRLPQELSVPRSAPVRDARRDDGISECSACSNPNTPVIQKRTLPLLRCIHLIRDGIVDQPGNKLTLTLEADRNGEQRNAMEEIRGAVERIDDPAVR